MEEEAGGLSNVDKAERGEEKSGTDGETLQKSDELDAEDVKDAGEAVDQIPSSVNESTVVEGGRVDIMDDQGTETLEVNIDQAEEFNSIREVEEAKDTIDGQQFAELPMSDGDKVEAEGVNEIGGVEEGKTELVDGGTEAKGDKGEAQGLQLDISERHVDILTKDDVKMVELRKEAMIAAEKVADAVGVGRQENNSEFNIGMEIVADACYRLEEVKEVDDVGTQASGGMLLEVENVGADVLNGSKLENTGDGHDAMRCEHAQLDELGDEQCSVSSRELVEGEKLNENILKDFQIGTVDEHVHVSFEHMEMNDTKCLKTESKMVDENEDVENSSEPKADEPVNEHFHSPHAMGQDVSDIISGISGCKVPKDENVGVEITTDSTIEDPEDKEGPENKDVKDVEGLESAMVVAECASMEAANNSRSEEPMVKHVEDKEMDDVDGLEHVIKETSKESTLGETIDISQSGNTTLATERHPSGNIRTETDAREEAEFTEKDTTATVESRDVTLQTEEHLAGDIKMDVGAGEEAELTRKDIMEGTSLDNDDVINDVGTSGIADELQDEVAEIDWDETRSDVGEFFPKRNDSSGTPKDGEDIQMVAEEDTGIQDTEMETETEVAESGKIPGGKRKGENISKIPNSKAAPKATSRKIAGDDVCFICFDGGKLVLCDRRGCPKAYHPSCVNRDEAFFKSKGSWNCGWHFCSTCEKNARYMCYTCTFSLCNTCIKDAVFFCVRETKGFCETCMKSVRLIENSEQENNEVIVDFDDKSSWEYLFKDYYVELKEKQSLSPAEISGARNPRRVGDMLSGPSNEPFQARDHVNDGESGSDNFIENSASNRPKRRKISKKANSTPNNGVVPRGKSTSSIENLDWASKELLEFVSYMKDGETSMISQYDVQALLLEYIKRKNLRDRRTKSQIICDVRLQNLFGKPRVGHFEMLKLLESHFLLKGEQNDDVQASHVDTESQLDIDGNIEPPAKAAKDKKRKARRKGRGNQSNLEDYAAIDMHSINLIYLRRKLVEDLLDDAEHFGDKVIGTFVRIRILGSNQKQDLYRLVQVVGTSKAQDPYKVGKKTIDIMLDILNLDKNETVSIDTLSNQEFTEEECKRLRQSIKCGFISRLTVGEILDKTMEIQNARVNDWLETETMRLSHLRDRASDLGRRKELRECVEKLQLLKTPEERQRRMEEIPEIHSDPKMDPAYESEDNDSEPEDTKRDAFTQSRASSFNQRARGPISPITEKDSWSGSNQTPSRDLSRNISISSSQISDTASEKIWKPERDRNMRELSLPENVNAKREASASSTLLPPLSLSPVVKTEPPSVKINESEKMWHYRDPNGKVQGPFSIVQLRKWNNNSYFPADLKIWKAEDIEENSILLTEALAGKFPKESPVIAANNVRGSQTLVVHRSSQEDRERSLLGEQISGSVSKFSSEKWGRSESTNLPSPTPGKQSPFTVQSPAVNVAAVAQSLPSPTPVLPNLTVAKSNVTSPVQSLGGLMSPTPTVSGSSNGVEHQEPSVVVQALSGQNLLVDPQNWSGGPQSTQQPPQVHGWSQLSFHNPGVNFSGPGQTVGVQPNFWGPTQGNQQANIQSNTSWAPWGSGAPGQGPMPGVGWVPQNGNIGTPLPPQGQPLPVGNTSQGWVPSRQDPTTGGGGGQYSGRGGRPWNNNRQPYGGGGAGAAWRRETICPYNGNGRCRKGSRCDYRHI